MQIMKFSDNHLFYLYKHLQYLRNTPSEKIVGMHEKLWIKIFSFAFYIHGHTSEPIENFCID